MSKWWYTSSLEKVHNKIWNTEAPFMLTDTVLRLLLTQNKVTYNYIKKTCRFTEYII